MRLFEDLQFLHKLKKFWYGPARRLEQSRTFVVFIGLLPMRHSLQKKLCKFNNSWADGDVWRVVVDKSIDKYLNTDRMHSMKFPNF